MQQISPSGNRSGLAAKVMITLSAVFLFVNMAITPLLSDSSNPSRLLDVSESSTQSEDIFPFDETYYDTSYRHTRNKKILLGVFSTEREKQFSRRQLIRNTYLKESENDERVCNLYKYQELMDQKKWEEADKCVILFCFVVGHPDGHDETDHFQSDRPLALSPDNVPHEGMDDDVVYLNIRENMVTGKTPVYFKWAASISTKYNIDYIVKLDDDTMLSMSHLFHDIVAPLPPYPFNKRYYGGKIVDAMQCGVHIYEYCKLIVPNGYIAGQFYFLSPDLAHAVSTDDQPRISNTKIEDLDLGRAVFRFSDQYRQSIKIVTHSKQYKAWKHPIKDSEEWMKLWNASKHDKKPYIK